MILQRMSLLGFELRTIDYHRRLKNIWNWEEPLFSIIEILPSMMISPFNDHNSKNLFLGVGLYGLIWDVRVKGTYTSEHSTTKIEIDSPRINKQTKIGIQTGLLFTIKTRLTVKSSYNLILTDDQVTQYFTLGIGYKFSK